MSKKALVVLGLFALGALWPTPPASACYYACVYQNGCESCQHVGHFTGGFCENTAPCVCIDVQDVCSAPQQAEPDLAAALDLAATAATCGGSPASAPSAPVL